MIMKKILLYNALSNMMLEIVVWTIYLKNHGWSVMQIALLEGFFTVCQLVFELPSGLISDKIGHKKTLLLGEGICILYLLTYFFPQYHAVMYGGFALFAIGLSLISGTDISILYESIAEDKKEEYLKYASYFTAIGVLATSLGNFSGGWIALYSWNILFIVAIILRVSAFIICTQITDENVNNDFMEKRKFSNLLKELKNFFTYEKKFIPILFTTCFSAAAITVSYQYGPLILESYNMRINIISSIFGVLSFLGSIAVVFTYRFSKNRDRDLIVIILQACSLITFILFFVNNFWIILIGLILVNVIYEIWNIILENKIQDIAYKNIRATIISVNNLLISGLLTSASFLIGIFSNELSLVSAVSIVTTMYLLISVLSMFMYKRKEK